MSNTFGHCFDNQKPCKVETLPSIQCLLHRAFAECSIESCSILKLSTQDCCRNCNLPVRPWQGLQCDGYNKWQHRTCNKTKRTHQEYRRDVRCREGIGWRCEKISNNGHFEELEQKLFRQNARL